MTNMLIYQGWHVDLRDPDVCDELHRLYENHKASDGRYEIYCLREHRGQMYLHERKRSLQMGGGRQLWAAHYQGQGGEGCSVGIGDPGDLASHANGEEYMKNVAAKMNWKAEPEYRGYGHRMPRPDLLIEAPYPMNVELEMHAKRNRPAIKAKSTRLMRTGVPPVFIGRDDEYTNKWDLWVPTLKFNPDLDWKRGVKQGSALAMNLMGIVPRPCTDRWFPESCPNRDWGWCGGFHVTYPELDKKFKRSLDEATIGLGNGELTRHRRWDGRVYIVPADDLVIYHEIEGGSGLFVADEPAIPPGAEDHAERKPCISVRHGDAIMPQLIQGCEPPPRCQCAAKVGGFCWLHERWNESPWYGAVSQ
jgi:hypothetical protein